MHTAILVLLLGILLQAGCSGSAAPLNMNAFNPDSASSTNQILRDEIIFKPPEKNFLRCNAGSTKSHATTRVIRFFINQ